MRLETLPASRPQGSRDHPGRLPGAVAALFAVLFATLVPLQGQTLSGTASDTAPSVEPPTSRRPAQPAGAADPTAEVAVSDRRPTAGEAFYLTVTLRWPGPFEDHLPHPPRWSLPRSLEAGDLTASTARVGDDSVVTYRLRLTAHRPGTLDLAPVEVAYTSSHRGVRVERHLSVPPVTVLPSTAASGGPGRRVGGGPLALTVAITLLLGTTLAFLRRRAEPLTASGDASPPMESPDTASPGPQGRRSGTGLLRRREQARRWRQVGRPELACRELLRLAATLDADGGGKERGDGEELDRVLPPRRREELRYGGAHPSGEELDRIEDWVDRRLATRRLPGTGTADPRPAEAP